MAIKYRSLQRRFARCQQQYQRGSNINAFGTKKQRRFEANKVLHDIMKEREMTSSLVVYSLQVLERSPCCQHNNTNRSGTRAVHASTDSVERCYGTIVSHYDGNKLQLSAPLEPNVNHQMTAFGGSLLSGCALVGWGLLQLQLGHMGRAGNVVVGRSDVDILRSRCGLLTRRERITQSFR